MLLSRVAERVYWQARYVERAENTARLISVISSLMMDLPPGTRLGWGSLIQITGNQQSFSERFKQARERQVIRFLLAERNGVSILEMLAAARENARTTREILPTEAFELINELYIRVREKADTGVNRGERYEFLADIVTECQQFWGLMAGTMSRDSTYSFVRMGRGLERADMTTRLVDAGSSNLLPDFEEELDAPGTREPYENILWMNILHSQSAYQMYRQHVREQVRAEEVVRFLLQSEKFPRATAHNLTTVTKVLENLPNSSRVKWQTDKVRRLVRDADIDNLLKRGMLHFFPHLFQSMEKGDVDSLMRRGLLHYLDNVQIEIAKVHLRITETWFRHNA